MIGNSSTLSFYVCAQDNLYAAEHYGVAISTTGNTSAADFTTIWEETLTAKSGAESGAKGMRGTRDQGTWYFKTVDLSAYAGQEVYIAIRHFNVSDEYFLDLDDVTLSAGRSRDVVANGVENMHLVPGTYYIVASSTDDNFTVDINVEPVPTQQVPQQVRCGDSPPR